MEVLKRDLATTAAIVKLDNDQHIVYAWAKIATVKGQPFVDSQQDMVSDADLEKAAATFVTKVRKAGEMHIKNDGVGEMVASIVLTAELQKALGIDLGKTGWLTGWKVHDDEVWKKIKNGEYAAMSIHGAGVRKEVTE